MKRHERETSDDDDELIGPAIPSNLIGQHSENKVAISYSNKEEAEEDIVGPSVAALQSKPSSQQIPLKKKKRVITPNEPVLLERLPNTKMYEKSFMHRDTVAFVTFSAQTGFLITASLDGFVKFWKKTEGKAGMEFVKSYRAHLQEIVAVSLCLNGSLYVSASLDRSFKIFDVVSFDMINMCVIDYVPGVLSWCYGGAQSRALLAVGDRDSSSIYLYDARDTSTSPSSHNSSIMVATPLHQITTLHSSPLSALAYNPIAQCAVSVDHSGMLEYWQPENAPNFEDTFVNGVSWEIKSDTDLYEFVKCKSRSVPHCIVFSPDFSIFATYGLGDRCIRLFRFSSGKLLKKYDESLEQEQVRHQQISSEIQTSPIYQKWDDLEFGRRIAIEKELEKSTASRYCNMVFDDSGTFLIFSSLHGVKILNVHSNRLVSIVGSGETSRFVNVALHQSMERRKNISLKLAASENPALEKMGGIVHEDPTLICTGFKKNRFFLFTKREPAGGEMRDVFNEKPTKDEQLSAAQVALKLPTSAILRTTFGDIFIRLFPEHAPKAVENFCTHSRNGYYNNLKFHRVAKGFMIQTGDPLGDGTGGESIWGEPFEDEFTPELRHNFAYTVSMANRGPNTNGSQFFITTVPATWLDDKHTIFGRVTSGMDVVERIESVKVRKEKPITEINIHNIEIRQ